MKRLLIALLLGTIVIIICGELRSFISAFSAGYLTASAYWIYLYFTKKPI